MCPGDSERDAAAGGGHARADAQRDRLAPRIDPSDGGPRPGAMPGVGSESRSRNVAGRFQSSARYPSRSNWSRGGCPRRPVPAAIMIEDAPAPRIASVAAERVSRWVQVQGRAGLSRLGTITGLESAWTHRRTSSAMRANASATAPRRRSLRTTATLIVLSNVPASVRPEPGRVEELARRPGPRACGARPRPSPRA